MSGLEISVELIFSVEQYFIAFHLNNILLDSHKTNNNDVCGRAGEKREYLEMRCQICTKLLIFAPVYEV